MKTRKQKVISRILCMVVSIFLLASFFVVPVSALDELITFTIQNQIYEYGYPTNPPDNDFKPYSSLKLVYDEEYLENMGDYYSDDMVEPTSVSNGLGSMVFEFNLENNFALLSYFVDTFLFETDGLSFVPGDTLFVNAGFMEVRLKSEMFTLTKCRFVIRNNADNYDFSFEDVVAATDVFDIYVHQGSLGFEYPQMIFTIYDIIPSDNLALCVEFYGSSFYENDRITEFKVSQFTIQYGVGKSPNYPIYPSAPGGDDIGHLDSQEQQLIQDSQAGLDAGVDVMENTGSLIADLEANLDLVAFTGALNQILNRLILIPGLDPLVHISLSLGLFASLFGLAASIISAASHRSGQAASESKRESRKK